ncbi:hypothetical protein Tco_1407050 [Tanacetum coccineum]
MSGTSYTASNIGTLWLKLRGKASRGMVMSQKKNPWDTLEFKISQWADIWSIGILAPELAGSWSCPILKVPSNEVISLVQKLDDVQNFNRLLTLTVNHDGTFKQIDIEKFKSALCEVDTKMKSLPPTAQLGAQQGKYVAKCFNWMKECEQKPKGPLRFRDTGRHGFKPFRYTHLCQFAPLGGEQTAD